MAERNSLFISRALLQHDHQKLRKNMDDFNHEMPDITMQWRRLGQVGVMMVQSGEYEALTRMPRSQLKKRPVKQVANELNATPLKEYGRMAVPLKTARFLGHNTARYVHVGFSIDPRELQEEREEITQVLDTMNQVPGNWRHEFQPFLSIATLEGVMADKEVLDSFQDIMPKKVTLYNPQARIG